MPPEGSYSELINHLLKGATSSRELLIRNTCRIEISIYDSEEMPYKALEQRVEGSTGPQSQGTPAQLRTCRSTCDRVGRTTALRPTRTRCLQPADQAATTAAAPDWGGSNLTAGDSRGCTQHLARAFSRPHGQKKHKTAFGSGVRARACAADRCCPRCRFGQKMAGAHRAAHSPNATMMQAGTVQMQYASARPTLPGQTLHPGGARAQHRRHPRTLAGSPTGDPASARGWWRRQTSLLVPGFLAPSWPLLSPSSRPLLQAGILLSCCPRSCPLSATFLAPSRHLPGLLHLDGELQNMSASCFACCAFACPNPPRHSEARAITKTLDGAAVNERGS